MSERRVRRRVVSSSWGEETRQSRWQRRRDERELLKVAAAEEAVARVESARAEKAAWKSADYLPDSGERGPAALWTPKDFVAPSHRASTGILSTAYPFLADPGLGTSGMLMGRNLLGGTPFVFDPFALYKSKVINDPNIIISGKIGEGKSTLMKCLMSRGSIFGYRAYVPADVKGEWNEPIRRVGGAAFELGRGMGARINPLEQPIKRPASIPVEKWDEICRSRRYELLEAIIERLESRGLEGVEKSALRYALEQVYRRHWEEPTLSHVVHELFHPEKSADGNLPEGFRSLEDVSRASYRAGHALAELTDPTALGGVLDQPSRGVQFDQSSAGVSVDVSRLEGNKLLDIVMTCTSTWMEAALRDGTDSQRFMLYDEGWRTFARPALLRRMQEHWKVSRNWGISNILTMHGFGDLETAGDGGQASRAIAANLVSDSATVVSFRQSGRAVDSAQSMLDLTDTAGSLLSRLHKGQTLWRVGQQMAMVQITRTTREAKVFDTDERMAGNAAA